MRGFLLVECSTCVHFLFAALLFDFLLYQFVHGALYLVRDDQNVVGVEQGCRDVRDNRWAITRITRNRKGGRWYVIPGQRCQMLLPTDDPKQVLYCHPLVHHCPSATSSRRPPAKTFLFLFSPSVVSCSKSQNFQSNLAQSSLFLVKSVRSWVLSSQCVSRKLPLV